ncbi:kinase-like protein [Parathielavia hyrcaniae]|uniref:Kinase-like protein n=1 Tax=Parathielavia hyrcaniae TaxID=113614 RepID=A0AAN6PWG2_9PEZI|nr:kinase-like protein [Parathielavia hyrcaniae]
MAASGGLRLRAVRGGWFWSSLEGGVHLDVRGTKLGRYRAVKVINKGVQEQDQKESEEGHKSPKAYYQHELKALSNPKYQGWFVRSFGWYEYGNRIHITMEYLEHGDLQQYLGELFSEDDTRTIASQVVKGIGFMHKYHFIHRDLKPDNLLVVDKPPRAWRVKISDFGISKRATGGADHHSTVHIGTQEYMAPEVYFAPRQHQGDKPSYTRAADIWALGAICIRMITRKPAFYLDELVDYSDRQGPFTPNDALGRHSISEDGRDFARELMARAPSLRLTAEQAAKHRWIVLSHRTAPATSPSLPHASKIETTALRKHVMFHAASYPEPVEQFQASARWEDSGVFDGEESADDAAIRPIGPSRRVR